VAQTPNSVPVGDVPSVPVTTVPLSEINRAPAPVPAAPPPPPIPLSAVDRAPDPVPAAPPPPPVPLSAIDLGPDSVPTEFVPVSEISVPTEPVGQRGPPGPTGPTGPAGPQGLTGATGPSGGGGGGDSLVNGANSFVLDADGNVVFEGADPGQAVNRGLVWDYGANVNGVNSQVRQDNAGLTVRAWTENSGNFAASVKIATNQDANTNTWIFSGDGDLLLAGNLVLPVDGSIRSLFITPAFNSNITGITTGNATVIVTIDDLVFEGPFSGTVTISGVNGTTEADGVWDYQATDFDQFQLFTDATLSTPVDGTFWTAYINGGTAVGDATYENLNVQGGNISISSNDNTWIFDTTGNLRIPNDIVSNTTIDIDNRTSGNTADIQLFAADDITLQARDRTAGSTSEGGDINILAGDSAVDGDSSGGDITIEAGRGGAANVDFGGAGGFITIQSGRGGAASTGVSGSSAEDGGSLTLNAGDAGDNNGNIDRGATGGDVFIESGFSTGNTNSGGDIVLTTGTGGQNATSGNVQINIPGYGLTTGGFWRFDATGNLVLPSGGIVYETSIPFGGLEGNTIALAPSGGTNADQQLLIYPTAGNVDANHLHLTSGNLYNTELYLGSDDLYVKLANTGNVVINSNDSAGNSAEWIFDTTGNLTASSTTLEGVGLTVATPPTTIVISGADFTPVNLTYTRDFGEVTPTWYPAGYNPGTDSYILFDGEWGIWNPAFEQAIYVNTGSINAPLAQWNTNPPLGSVAPTGVYTYSNPTWTFDITGSLTLPGGSRLRPLGPNLDIFAGTGSYVNLITSDESSYMGVGGAGGYVVTAGGTWDFNTNGNLTAPGNISAVGNITGGNIVASGSGGDITLTGGNITGAIRVVTTPTALANLTAVAGGRAFVNNANLVAAGNFGNLVGSGGSNVVPVWSDGTNWYIG
jgi:hypothetical protein